MLESAVQKPSLKPRNSKQCRCRSTVARKNSLERPESRKKPREEPGYEGWPVLFWVFWVEIINLERNQTPRGGQSSSGCAGWRL
jgi:hypothetical protein